MIYSRWLGDVYLLIEDALSFLTEKGSSKWKGNVLFFLHIQRVYTQTLEETNQKQIKIAGALACCT